jgi:hypothetical protein
VHTHRKRKLATAATTQRRDYLNLRSAFDTTIPFASIRINVTARREDVSSVHFEPPLEDANSLRTPAMCQLH